MSKLKIFIAFVFGLAVYGAAGKSIDISNNDGIIGGKEVDITQYPHQAAVLYKDKEHCGGSILNEEYVLAAAHCASPNFKNHKVRVGSSYYAKGGTLHEVSDITIHPKYNDKCYDYDVAVFKLKDKIAINGNTTKAVQLAKSDDSLKPNDLVDVAGWGRMENDEVSEVLRAITVPVVDRGYCQEVYEKYLPHIKMTDRMLCAGYDKPGQSTGGGDSGGPLIDHKTSVQFGVVSYNLGPNIPVPSVYTYIPAVRDWIHKVTGV